MNDLPVELQNHIYMYIKSDTAQLIKDYAKYAVEDGGAWFGDIVWTVQDNKELGFKTFNKDRYDLIQYGCDRCSCELNCKLKKKELKYPKEWFKYRYFCEDCYIKPDKDVYL